MRLLLIVLFCLVCSAAYGDTFTNKETGEVIEGRLIGSMVGENDVKELVIQNADHRRQVLLADDWTVEIIAPYEIAEIDIFNIKALGGKRLSEYTEEELAVLPTNRRRVYRVVVSPEIKESHISATVAKIIEEITNKDYDIDEISLLLYSDKELTDGAYDVASATWAPNGEWGSVTPHIAKSNNRDEYETAIEVREDLEKYLKQRAKSEKKRGLSESNRRKIFKKLVAAEDRAEDEANRLYPDNIQKNQAEFTKRAEKYRAKVRRTYKISRNMQDSIVIEGIEENWPTD